MGMWHDAKCEQAVLFFGCVALVFLGHVVPRVYWECNAISRCTTSRFNGCAGPLFDGFAVLFQGTWNNVLLGMRGAVEECTMIF